jgi:hypothetical protein
MLRVLAMVIAGHAMLGTAILNTGLIEHLASYEPEKMKLEHGFAWTVWPGTVHVADFDLRYQDRNIQFQLAIEAADVDISIPSLFRNTFFATRVRAEEVRWRMLHKVEDVEGQRERIAAFPEIFPGPPKRWGPQPPSEIDKLWKIRLQDVIASVAELWFLEYRWIGRGHVEGAFELRPYDELWVGPARLDLDPGTLTMGKEEMLKGFGGRIETTLHPVNPEEPDGAEMFDHISGLVKLEGELVSFDTLHVHAPSLDLRLLKPGRLEADVRFDHGVIEPKSAATAVFPSAIFRTKELAIVLSGGVKFDTDRSTSNVRADLRKARLMKGDRELAHGPHVMVAASSRSRRIAKLGRFRPSEVEIAQLEIPDLSVIGSKVQGGRAKIDLGLRRTSTVSLGAALVRVEDAKLTIGDRKLTASATIATDLAWSSATEGGELRRLSADLSLGASGRWKIRTPLVRLEKIPPRELEAEVTIASERGADLLSLIPPLGRIGDAFVSALPIGAVDVEAHVVKTEDRIAVHVVRGRSGAIHGEGRFAQVGEKGRAAFRFALDGLSVGLTFGAAGVRISPMATSDWLAERYRLLGLANPDSPAL